LAAARRAEGRLDGTEGPGWGQRVRQALAELEQEQADRRMLAALEQAGLLLVELSGEALDPGPVADAYARGFRAYGMNPLSGPVEEAARRVGAGAPRAALAAALRAWAGVPGRAKHAGRLREVARLGDPDPGRLRLRQAVARRDRAGLVALAGPRQLAA